MRAAIFPGPEQIDVITMPDPTPAADEVVIRVAACGICGTDVHIFRNEYNTDFPIVPGHEFSGEIVAVGGDVTTLRIGERVAADPNIGCGACDFCRAGLPNHCTLWRVVGVTQPGAFAEYVTVPARCCFKLPEGMSDTQAALIEPLSCVVHALRRVRVMPGEEALLFGAGPIGLLLAQGFAHSGAARVTVVERSPARLELAQQLGFATVLADDTLDERLREAAPGGFPLVADATGNPQVIERAPTWLRPGGQYLQFGVAPANATVRWRPYDLFRNDWTFIGSFALRYSFAPAVAWIQHGVIDTSMIVSHNVSLTEFPGAFKAFTRGETLKVHVRP